MFSKTFLPRFIFLPGLISCKILARILQVLNQLARFLQVLISLITRVDISLSRNWLIKKAAEPIQFLPAPSAVGKNKLGDYCFRRHAILPIPENEDSVKILAKAADMFYSWKGIDHGIKFYLGYAKDRSFPSDEASKKYGWIPIDKKRKELNDR